MRKTIFIILILVTVLGGSLSARQSKARLLEKNLNQWEQFRWQGIIQVSVSSFSARMNFVLSKTKEEMRLDVLEGGIMGLQAKPVVSVYLKDKIVLEAPTIKQLEGIDLNWFIPKGAIIRFTQFTDTLRAGSEEILSGRKLITKNTDYSFDRKYRLTGIISRDMALRAKIIYNRRNQPTKLLIDHGDSRILELQINEQAYDDITITPLKAPADSMDFEKLPEDLPLEELEIEPE